MTPVKVLFPIALTVWGLSNLGHGAEAFKFLHGVDLLIHEFGHPFFSLFGNDIVTALGGTLAQLILPSLFVTYFWFHDQHYAAIITLFWVGQNVFDVAVYLRDAPSQALPLIGRGQHDWNYLLTEWGILDRSETVAGILIHIVRVLFLMVGIGGAYLAIGQNTSDTRSQTR